MRAKSPRFLAVMFGVILSLVLPLRAAVTNYVTTTADSGPGSLRQAIADSSSGAAIQFRTNGIITLLSGELQITKSLTIIGPGALSLAVSGNNASRVFSISADATTSISGLTIRDGRTTNDVSAGGSRTSGGSGGGVYNLGTLVLSDCIITANATSQGYTGWNGGSGGGLLNKGVLTLNRCVFFGNRTGAGGGGSNGQFGGGPGGSGGGLWNEAGTITATTCAFSGNSCGAGGGVPGSGGSGGGIGNSGSCLISASTFNGNSAGAGGLGTGAGGDGGGIFNVGSGIVNVSGCTLSGNTAGAAGTNANDAGAGGRGGGLFNSSSCTALVSACTFSGNSSGLSLVGNGNGGGGVFNNGILSVVSSTIVSNFAWYGYGGGIRTYFMLDVSPPAILRNTLIAGNVNYGSPLSAPDTYGIFASEGHNFIGAVGPLGFQANNCRCDFIGTSSMPINPLLGPLQDNGGPVWTHALLAGSPAIDAGANSGLAFDARGQPRTIDNPAVTNAFGGDGTDIGAFEVNHILTSTETRRAGDDIQVRFTTVSDKTYGVEFRPEAGEGPWTELPRTVAGTGGIVTYTDVNAATKPRRFYRIFERAP